MTLSIEPGFCFFLALLLLTLPLPWLLAAAFAALVHEICHLAVLYILKCKVSRVRIGAGGARIETALPDRKWALLADLAGPAGSLALLGLSCTFPKAAVCGCIQGIYNLLPIRPLDGGRALGSVLEMLCPASAQWVMIVVESAMLVVLALSAAYCALVCPSLWMVCIGMLLVRSAESRRNIPCKGRDFGVQ